MSRFNNDVDFIYQQLLEIPLQVGLKFLNKNSFINTILNSLLKDKHLYFTDISTGIILATRMSLEPTSKHEVFSC